MSVGSEKAEFNTTTPKLLHGVLTPMRILVLLVLAGVLMLRVCVSQTAAPSMSFGAVTFNPPAGWQIQQGRDFVAFTNADTGKSIFCKLAIYSSQYTAQDPGIAFAREWQEIVLTNFSAGLPSISTGRTGSDLEFVEGQAEVSQHGAPSYAVLRVFTGAPRVVSVVILTRNRKSMDNYSGPINSFMESLRFAGTDVAAQDRGSAGVIGTRNDSHAAVVGKWFIGAGSLLMYNNPITGLSAPARSGSGSYEFSMDGSYVEASRYELRSYGCVTTTSSYVQGTWTVQGSTMQLSPRSGTYKHENSCNPSGNTERPTFRTKKNVSFRFKPDEYSKQEELCLTAKTREAGELEAGELCYQRDRSSK